MASSAFDSRMPKAVEVGPREAGACISPELRKGVKAGCC